MCPSHIHLLNELCSFSVSWNGWTVGTGTLFFTPHWYSTSHSEVLSASGSNCCSQESCNKVRACMEPIPWLLFKVLPMQILWQVNIMGKLGKEMVIKFAARSAQNILLLSWVLQINNIYRPDLQQMANSWLAGMFSAALLPQLADPWMVL